MVYAELILRQLELEVRSMKNRERIQNIKRHIVFARILNERT